MSEDSTVLGEEMTATQDEGLEELHAENARLRAQLADSQAANALLVQRNAELERLVHQDALTGLLNRRRFEHEMNLIAPARMSRENVNCALLMLDLNDFKTTNDELGHKAGDDALKALAEVFEHVLRPLDQIFRIGGDEFVVVLYDVSEENVLAIATRIVRAVAGVRLQHASGDFGISVSIGGALCNEVLGKTADTTAFIGLADKNMYASKRLYADRSSENTLPVAIIKTLL